MSRFATDVLRLASGTTLAQALMVLAAPVLTRFYSPEEFGGWALFVSLGGTLTIVSCLRYELAIVLPEEDAKAANLFALSIASAFVVAALTLPPFALAPATIAGWLNAPGLEAYLPLVPLAVLLGGLLLALNQWSARFKRFGVMATTEVVGAGTTLTAQIGAGAAAAATGGLIVGRLLGQATMVLTLALRTARRDRTTLREAVTLAGALAGARRYARFPLYSGWAGLLNHLSWQLPFLMLAYFFSAEVVGFYALGNQVIRLPMSVVGNSIRYVFYQRAAEMMHQGRLTSLVEGVYRLLVRVSMLPILVFSAISPELFGLAFGAAWTEAGVYTQILGLWSFFWFTSTPLSSLLLTLERQDLNLRINLALFVLRFLALLLGGHLGSARGTIALLAVSGVILYGCLGYVTLTAAGVRPRRVVGELARNAVPCVPALLVILGLNWLAVPDLVVVAVGVAVILVHGGFLIGDPAIREVLLGAARRPGTASG